MAEILTHQLNETRKELSSLLNQRKQDMPPEPPASFGRPYPEYELEEAALKWLNRLYAHTMADVSRFQLAANKSARQQASEEEDSQERLAQAEAEKARRAAIEEGQASLDDDADIDERGEEAPPPPPPKKEPSRQKQGAQIEAPFDHDLSFLPNKLKEINFRSPFHGIPNPNLTESDMGKLSEEGKKLYAFLEEEVEKIGLNLVENNMSGPTYQKIRRAMQTFVSGKIGDALIILRNAQKDDPHNRFLAMIISQLLYYRAFKGEQEYLPEAREAGKRSGTFDDKLPNRRMAQFRYHYMASEMYFQPERAMELMREYYLVGEDVLLTEEGLTANNGLYLKALVLLSKQPIMEWTSHEREAIYTLATKTVGGALIYMHFFRRCILNALEADNKDFEDFKTVEHMLRTTWLRHKEAYSNIKEHFDAKARPYSAPVLLWTVTSRYLKMLLSTSPLPSFDNMIANTSLDGTRHAQTDYLDDLMRESGLPNIHFWQVWIMKTTSNPDIFKDEALPERTVLADAPLLKSYEALLKTLREVESPYIKDERWQKGEQYLAPLSCEQLLEIGTGNPMAGKSHDNEGAVYKKYFKTWRSEMDGHPVPSNTIKELAEWGTFWNVEEIQAAFDGVERMLEDPVIGLRARMRAAYRKYLAKNSNSREAQRERRQQAWSNHFRELWWFYFILIPISVVTFGLIVSSESYSSGLQSVLILIAVMFGCGLLIFKIIGKEGFAALKAGGSANVAPEQSEDDASHEEEPVMEGADIPAPGDNVTTKE